MQWGTLKKFKNQVNLVREAVDDASSTNIGFQIKGDQDKGMDFSLKLPPKKEIARFAAVLKPLADPSSPLHYKKIIALLEECNFLELSEAEKIDFEREIKRTESGGITLKLNDKHVTAVDLYNLYSNGEFFDEKPEEAKKLKALKKDPFLSKYVLYQFYSYCCDVYRLSGYLYSVIRRAEAEMKIEEIKTSAVEPAQCIYCLKSDGTFNSVEHVFPESLGNTEMILPAGNVCDACNHGVLAKLDNDLVKHDSISLLRVLALPYNTKTGKFPKAHYQNMTIEKTGPRNIEFNQFSKDREGFTYEEHGNVVKSNLSLKGRTKFNPQQLGRSLYKVALGVVCYEHGRKTALDSRYDKAREYILGKCSFPNNLFISKHSVPNAEIRSTHYLRPGTLFVLEIFGITFSFNLEVAPHLEMHPLLEEMEVQCYSLE